MRTNKLLELIALVGISGLTVHAADAAPPPPAPTGTTPPLPPAPPIGPCATRLCGPQRWNFEPTAAPTMSSVGATQGWTGRITSASGTSPFGAHGLVAGPAVFTRKVLASSAAATIPPGHEQIASLQGLPLLGGNYWDAPYHTGFEGSFWLSSLENHMTFGSAVGVTRGEAATMDVVSPEFSVGPRYLHFLAGGGCSANVHVSLEQKIYARPGTVGCTKQENALVAAQAAVVRDCAPGGIYINCVVARSQLTEAQTALDACRAASGGTTGMIPVADPVWEPVTLRWENPITHEVTFSTPFRHVRSGERCSEAMSRVRWDMADLTSRAEDVGYRIRVVDDSTTAHISVDDFWLTYEASVPEPKLPVWGAADLHAHLMNEVGTMAFGGDGRIESRALWGSAVGPIESMTRCNYTHTTNDDAFNSHSDEVTGTTYTLFRQLGLEKLETEGRGEAGGSHSTNGGAPGDWTDWPLWSNAIHQQMHETWVRRAYEGGLRLMLAAVGNAEAIGFGLAGERGNPFMSDQDALALQIPAIRSFASRNASWAEIALTPQDARRIIRSGKMAIVVGSELDHIMDSCDADVTTVRHHVAHDWGGVDAWSVDRGLALDWTESDPNTIVGTVGATFGNLLVSSRVMHVDSHPRTCTGAQIEARLDAIYRAGVRQIIPMHFSDNMLGGYAVTGALFTSNAVFGDADARPPRFMSRAEAAANGIDLATFGNDIGPFVNSPLWVRLGVEQILDLGSHVPPGAGRAFLDFVSMRCIEDDGWRAFAAIFTLGASEVACAASELTDLLLEIPREITPWEGATDTPALGAFRLPDSQRVGTGTGRLPSQINARGLQPDGERFITEMMRRGMLIDLQHASELSRRRILELAGTYPVMASHGGATLAATGIRPNENSMSREQVLRIYQAGGPGLMGGGTQSAQSYARLLRDTRVELGRTDFAMALGTDMNGFDWHSFPRFGPDGFLRESPTQRANRVALGMVGPMVNYAAYDATTNSRATGPAPACNGCTWPSARATSPALTPHTISRGGRVVRTFDINVDGYSHYGMTPDFLQEVRDVGATPSDMAAVFRSAESTIRMWESSCAQAYARTTRPSSITMGCGPRGDYP